MNFFNKMSKSGVTDSAGLYITNRQMSWLLSFVLFLAFFIFIVGYFLGKKVAMQELVQEMEVNSLEDAHAIIGYQHDTQAEEGKAAQQETLVVAEKVAIEKKEESAVNTPMPQQVAENKTQQSSTRYYAELIGFGTQQAAQSFADKLQRKGVQIEVRKRSSMSAKGRSITWYQVVTKPSHEKKEITQLVEKLRRQEHLADVRILTC